MSKNNLIKSFIIPVIFVIFLLAIQALCDLELPEYTSTIINDGISHKGISYAVPEVLTEDMYNSLLRISNEDVSIIASYNLIVKDNLSTKDYTKLSKEYKALKKGNIYLLNDLDEKELQVMETKLSKPLILYNMLANNNESIANALNIPISDDVSLLNVLMSFDNETFTNIINSLSASFDNYDESMLKEYSYLSIEDIYNKVGINLDDYQMNFIINKGLMMLAIAAFGMIIAIVSGYIISKIASRVSYILRNKVVAKIMAFSTAEFKEFGASSLITRSTNDVEQIKMFSIMLFRIVIFAPIMGIGAFIKVYDNPLNWLIAIALIAILVLISVLFSLAMPKFKVMQKLIDKMNLVSREIITGMPVIRSFNTEEHEEKRYDEANINLTKNNLFVNRLMGIMLPSMMFVMNFVSILIVWFGAKEIDLGTLQVGSLLAFITYTMQIIMSFLMISLVSVMLPRALVSIKRIKEILKKDISIKEPLNPLNFDDTKKGIVEFKNVSFKYPDADEAMLKNISFKATPGTTTAFIGSTGSGKSTLINLIPRFFDATEGEILVDGINIKEASIKDLRSRIGYVPQKGMLFSGSIASNIKFSDENIPDAQMEEAAIISQSYDFIQEKEDKFASAISEGGSNVSGGQKQRLSIARAIAKNPEIYIFDDSFSALDFKTDAALRKALNKSAKNATVLIVAQRINTIMNADNIIVLNEGEIIGSGTHKELLKTCKVYKEIALSQIKEEEL